MQTQDMEQHLKIVGWLHVVNGLFAIAIALFVATLMTGAGVLAAAEEGAGIFALLAGIGWAIAVFVGLLSLPSILGGWGILNYKPWSRVTVMVVSALSLLSFPVGTLIGGYSLWVLLNDESRLLLESGGRRQIAPY